MRRVIVVGAVLAAGLAAVLFGPRLARRGMQHCREMMAGMSQAASCHGEPLKSSSPGDVALRASR